MTCRPARFALSLVLATALVSPALAERKGPDPKRKVAVLEYRAGSGTIELDRHPGDGPDMTSFQQISIPLPPEALRRDCY